MSIEVMKQWLECVERCDAIDGVYSWSGVVDSLRKATAEAAQVRPEQAEQQEPVAWMFEDDEDNGHKTFHQTPPSHEAVAYLAKWNRPAWVPLYTTQPQRTWVGLTESEKSAALYDKDGMTLDYEDYAEAIEAKLKEKNT